MEPCCFRNPFFTAATRTEAMLLNKGKEKSRRKPSCATRTTVKFSFLVYKYREQKSAGEGLIINSDCFTPYAGRRRERGKPA